jgi:hypothetical protein
MTAFETIADALAAPATGLSTGLPQLDRIAPLGPGHLAVLIGASGVGKSRVAAHITGTLASTHVRGVLAVSTATTLDALDSALAFRTPAIAVIDPLTAIANAEAGDTDPEADQDAEQGPVHPAELGRIAERMRGIASRHHVPILVCHRFTPIRDSVTGQIVSTEAANPLLDQADLVAVVRVLADPQQVGLELLRNRIGPLTTLRVPLPGLHDMRERAATAADQSPVLDTTAVRP